MPFKKKKKSGIDYTARVSLAKGAMKKQRAEGIKRSLMSLGLMKQVLGVFQGIVYMERPRGQV